MKRTSLSVLVLLSLLTLSVHAQQATTKRECNRRCNELDAAPAVLEPHKKKLKEIEAKKKAETDPAKLKALDEEEADLIERYNDKRAQVCASFCRNNPED